MRILNITGAHIKMRFGSNYKMIKNGEISDRIILTPELLQNSIRPLALQYRDKFKISITATELSLFNDNSFPTTNIVDDKVLVQELNKWKAQQKKLEQQRAQQEAKKGNQGNPNPTPNPNPAPSPLNPDGQDPNSSGAEGSPDNVSGDETTKTE